MSSRWSENAQEHDVMMTDEQLAHAYGKARRPARRKEQDESKRRQPSVRRCSRPFS